MNGENDLFFVAAGDTFTFEELQKYLSKNGRAYHAQKGVYFESGDINLCKVDVELSTHKNNRYLMLRVHMFTGRSGLLYIGQCTDLAVNLNVHFPGFEFYHSMYSIEEDVLILNYKEKRESFW